LADNVYALLQQAWAVSKTSDANMYGVEIALVTNVKDPEKQGRVKVCFPRLPGKPESDWARVAQPSAGPGRGFYWLPEVNDEVLVAFERGQANKPFVIGALWNGKDKPMKDAYTDENTTRMIQTKSGHQIVFNDKSGEEKITIADKSGKRTLTFDVKDKKFLIEAKEGDVEIHAKKKLVLQCEDLEIKTKKTGKIDIGSTFDLKVAQKAGFKAGPKMVLKAGKVNLNPPSLDLASLVAAALAAAARAAAAAAGANAAQQQAAAQAAAAAAAAMTGGASGSDIVPTKDVIAAAGGQASAEAAQTAGAAALEGAEWTKAKEGAKGAAGGATGGAAPGGAASGGAASGGAAPDGAASGAGKAPNAEAAADGVTGGGEAQPAAEDPAAQEIEVQLLTAQGQPASDRLFRILLPDGTKIEGRSDKDGKIKSRVEAKGDVTLVLPEFERA
jgi:hypothetical protein